MGKKTFMKNAKKALLWITDILKQHEIPFQITGGLAAIAYGATRPLEDIDIDIPDDKFDVISEAVKPFVVSGPERFKSDKWNLLLMTLNYEGQLIDLSGADTTFIFSEKTQGWVKLVEDFTQASNKTIFGLSLPVIPRLSLIQYKTILARDVDLIDIEQIKN